jgi:hypothetical protein
MCVYIWRVTAFPGRGVRGHEGGGAVPRAAVRGRHLPGGHIVQGLPDRWGVGSGKQVRSISLNHNDLKIYMRSILQRLSNVLILCLYVSVCGSARGENSYAHQNDMQVGLTALATAHERMIQNVI